MAKDLELGRDTDMLLLGEYVCTKGRRKKFSVWPRSRCSYLVDRVLRAILHLSPETYDQIGFDFLPRLETDFTRV